MSSTRELMKMKERLRRYLSDHLLGLNDSPHRIALGVGLGVFIAFTPTFGLQILLYLAIASAIGANKISGIGPLFINNPFTLLPLVYGAWRLGAFIMGASSAALPPLAWEGDLALTLGSVTELGVEIWIGSIILGALAAIPAYFAALFAIARYRRRIGEPLPPNASGPESESGAAN